MASAVAMTCATSILWMKYNRCGPCFISVWLIFFLSYWLTAKRRYILVSLLSVIAARNVYLFIYRVLLFNMLSRIGYTIEHRTIPGISNLKIGANHLYYKLMLQNIAELQALAESINYV